VVPCPIRPDELTRRTAVRRRKARMDDRTRQRLPVLPVLVAAAAQLHWSCRARTFRGIESILQQERA